MAKLKDALIPYGDIKRKQSLGRGAQGEVFIGTNLEKKIVFSMADRGAIGNPRHHFVVI